VTQPPPPYRQQPFGQQSGQPAPQQAQPPQTRAYPPFQQAPDPTPYGQPAGQPPPFGPPPNSWQHARPPMPQPAAARPYPQPTPPAGATSGPQWWPGPPPPPWSPRPPYPVPPYPAAPAGRPRIDAVRLFAALILVALGTVVLHAVAAGSYLSFVRPVMRIPLGAAGAVLLLAGAAGSLTALRRDPPQHHDGQAGHAGHGHGGDGGHGRGRLLLPVPLLLAVLPVAVLVLVRPPALDAAATDNVPTAAAPVDTGTEVQPLAGPADKPVALTFNEVTIRANAGNGPATLRGRTLRLTGFVPKNPGNAPAGTVRIGRYLIWCCAADATFSDTYLRWPAGTPAPEPGTWYTVQGRVVDILGDPGDRHVILDVDHADAIPQPHEPYEH
jgi:uncharacterized repeat protein (TIGR03943 family)